MSNRQGPNQYAVPAPPAPAGGRFNQSRPKTSLEWVELRAREMPGPRTAALMYQSLSPVCLFLSVCLSVSSPFPPPTAKSKCPCSSQQRKGPGTKSIAVIAKGSRYNINFTGLQLYRDKSELIRIPGFVPRNFCRVLLRIEPSRQNRHSR